MSLLSQISRGRTYAPPRILLYGIEGIGKSTFASNFPAPVFVQTEDGLGELDCAKFPLCKTAGAALDQLTALASQPNDYKTVVVDSLDWLERLIWDGVCLDNRVKAIDNIPYGKGYGIALAHWREVLDVLSALRDQGKLILLLAHAAPEEYSDPEVSNLVRYVPRLHKLARSLVKEYVDLVLLATRLHGAAKGESEGNPRVVRSSPTPFQDAKTRYAIPNVLPLDAAAVLDAIRQSYGGGQTGGTNGQC